VSFLLVLLTTSLAFAGIGLLGELGRDLSFPRAAGTPLLAVAVGASILGLWLGHRQHGRGEPLAVGLFGLLVTMCGLLTADSVAFFGASIVVASALWSALAKPVETRT
jgi:hypothetical protein